MHLGVSSATGCCHVFVLHWGTLVDAFGGGLCVDADRVAFGLRGGSGLLEGVCAVGL